MNDLDYDIDHNLDNNAAREGTCLFIRMLEDVRDWEDIVGNPQMLIEMLSNFRLTREEEKGDITGIFSTRSLNARYFKSNISKKKMDNDIGISVIKRGTILSIKQAPQYVFLVLSVLKKAGKNIFKNGENVAWPYIKGGERDFKLQIAEIVYESKTDVWRIRQYCDIVDGLNVRKTHRMVLLEDVLNVISYVDY